MKLISSTRTVILPEYTTDGFQDVESPNFAKNVALSGKMYVDFYNRRNGWKIKFDVLTSDEYDELKAIYQDQFTNEEFLTFDRTGLSGDMVSVFLVMPPERNVVWNKSAVRDLQIALEPEDADS